MKLQLKPCDQKLEGLQTLYQAKPDVQNPEWK